jgi:hypothetical protein
VSSQVHLGSGSGPVAVEEDLFYDPTARISGGISARLSVSVPRELRKVTIEDSAPSFHFGCAVASIPPDVLARRRIVARIELSSNNFIGEGGLCGETRAIRNIFWLLFSLLQLFFLSVHRRLLATHL